MRLDTVSTLLIWASVIAFGVHNLEETYAIEGWMAGRNLPAIASLYRKKPFFIASSLLWVVYVVVVALAFRSTNTIALRVLFVAFAAIVANGLFHVLAAPVFRKTPPGFWSALTLVLPLGGLFAWHMITTGLLTYKQTLVTLLIGAVLQIPLAAGAILIAASLCGLKWKSSRK